MSRRCTVHPTQYPETDDDDADAEDALGEGGGNAEREHDVDDQLLNPRLAIDCDDDVWGCRTRIC